MFSFIDQQEQLNQVIELMRLHDTYYLDTEFIRTNTRYPILGLIQLNVNEQIFIIDPLHLELSAFWDILFTAKFNVLHACNEDITLIYHYSKKTNLNNVFDTQIALSFLNYGANVGYQSALQECLNIAIDKHETRSNWLARPLSNEQLNYASNDVLYLSQLHRFIQEKLMARQLYNAVIEDCNNTVKEISEQYTLPSEQIYLNFASPSHTARQLAQLQQLTKWREELSQKRNIPTAFILKNKEILNIIQKQPKTEFQVVQCLNNKTTTSKNVSTILKLIHRLPDAKTWPKPLAKPYLSQSDNFHNELQTLIEHTAQDLQIPTDVLMRKKWLKDIQVMIQNNTAEHELSDFLLGWRYDIITQPIIKMMYNDKSNS